MTKYRIVAARPKNSDNHLKSEFKLYRLNEEKNEWNSVGWKSIGDVSSLIHSGNEVRTGKIVDGSMSSGAPVEVELRIAKNDTKYKISDMPDK
ncbi:MULTISPECIES: hypothetical protein [Pseudomonadota]|jgi:hypothetical protein|uniref:hypothetical protein n=1 Tax=Pseudomonadota TaxID=1224 RepID=UPI0009B363F8|nr:hypothetical protein [Burkholderia cenocepacia]